MDRIRRKRLQSVACLFAAVALASMVVTARADVVYLKDGTILYGKVVSPKEAFTDPSSGQSFVVLKSGGFFAVTDGTRVVVFPSRQMARDPEDTNTFAGQLSFERMYPRPIKAMPPAGEFKKVTEFNQYGERTLNLQTPMGPEPVRQRLTHLTPFRLRLDAVDFKWDSHYLISEFEPSVIAKLVRQFDRVKEEPGKPDAGKRMLMYRFFTQAKQYDLAEKELDRLLKDLPTAKEDVEKARGEMRDLKAEKEIEDAGLALASGQVRIAQAYLERVPKQGLGGNLNVQATTLRVRIDNLVKQFAQAQRYLRLLPDEAEGEYAEALVEAAAVIRDDLYYDALERIEPFLSLAEQAENARKQNREPSDRPEDLLARAVTGWLLGKELSEGKPARAAKLWRAREFAMKYLQSNDSRTRGKMLEAYQKYDAVEPEEMARIVAMLPPPEPAPPAKNFEPISVKTTFGKRSSVDYAILPPAEYQPARPYPLLVVLGHKGDKPSEFIKRFGYHAIRQGFIVASVDWSDGLDAPYSYSADEHQRVLDVIRDVKQHYHVDSDRVFLSGFGEGGNAAWDIGLSHPDCFAGVAPISSQPKQNNTLPYSPNAMNLPFYIVTGDVAGDAPKQIMRIFQDWLPKGYPALHVLYRGRGMEWFGGELPYIFEWMSKKKRVGGFPELGKPRQVGPGQPEMYMCMRTTDNRFYWLSSDSIDGRYLFDTKAPKTTARFQGTIKPGNEIRIETLGLKDITIWLAPGMVDFTRSVKVITIGSNGQEKTWLSKTPIKPSMTVLMEDMYSRFDTRRPFVAQISLVP